MFAVVRTGGKQYRVAPGDKIVVEKMTGEAGDQVTLGDILLAGDGSDLKDLAGLTVAAEIIAQAKADKVIVFKKRRRHNYRRKMGHRQQHTILRIVSIGGEDQKRTGGDTAARPATRNAASAPSPSDVGETPTSEGVVPADAGMTATHDVSTENAAPAKAAAKKTPKAK